MIGGRSIVAAVIIEVSIEVDPVIPALFNSAGNGGGEFYCFRLLL